MSNLLFDLNRKDRKKQIKPFLVKEGDKKIALNSHELIRYPSKISKNKTRQEIS